MIKFGKIIEVNNSKGLARVDFTGEELQSGFLQILVPSTSTTKYYKTLSVGDNIAALMDEHLVYGVILGGIYSGDNTPEFNDSENGLKNSSGDKIIFNESDRKLELIISSINVLIENMEAEISNQSGAKIGIKNNKVVLKGVENISAILLDMLQWMQIHTHASSGSPAVTAPAIPLLSTRVNASME